MANLLRWINLLNDYLHVIMTVFSPSQDGLSAMILACVVTSCGESCGSSLGWVWTHPKGSISWKNEKSVTVETFNWKLPTFLGKQKRPPRKYSWKSMHKIRYFFFFKGNSLSNGLDRPVHDLRCWRSSSIYHLTYSWEKLAMRSWLSRRLWKLCYKRGMGQNKKKLIWIL